MVLGRRVSSCELAGWGMSEVRANVTVLVASGDAESFVCLPQEQQAAIGSDR